MMPVRPLRVPVWALALFAVFAGSGPAAAEERVLVLDPEESRITFTLGAFLHTVEGSFDVASGEIRYDPETGQASGEIVIDTASGTTNNRRRDRRMHSEVLLSERYPRFVFVPEHFEGGVGPAGGGVMLSGELEFFGSRHRLEIPAWVEPSTDGRVRASGGFKIPYHEWGMKDVSGFLLRVAEEVDVQIQAVGDLSTATPTDPDPQAPQSPQ
jgi:polyisoprenoid-binding protein YceI